MVWNLVPVPSWRATPAALCDRILDAARPGRGIGAGPGAPPPPADSGWPSLLTPLGVVWETWRGDGRTPSRSPGWCGSGESPSCCMRADGAAGISFPRPSPGHPDAAQPLPGHRPRRARPRRHQRRPLAAHGHQRPVDPERTGIRERRWVREGETGAELALAASRRALEAAGIAPADVDAIVYATVHAGPLRPGQRGLPAARAGRGPHSRHRYPDPVQRLRLRPGGGGRVDPHRVSTGTSWWSAPRCSPPRSTSAPGGGTRPSSSPTARAPSCWAPRKTASAASSPSTSTATGSHAEKLWVDCPGSMYHPRMSADQIEAGRHFLDMDGKEVFRHAVARMPESVRAALSKAGRTPRRPQACWWRTRRTCGSPR